jgi:hypothetical protein
MKKLVESVLFFVVVFFLTFAPTVFASYQPASGVVTDFPEIIYPENDGSSFMAPPFPRSTNNIGRNTLDGSTFVALYNTTAPTACSTVKSIRSEIVLKSTSNSPSEISIFFGAINKSGKTIIPGSFVQAPEITTAPNNNVGFYSFKTIEESVLFEYKFDSPVLYSDVLVMLKLDDAEDYAGLNSSRIETITFSDLTLSYVIKNVELDVNPIPCPVVKRKKTTGYYLKREKPQEKKCPVFTQYMKEGDRNGSIAQSKQQPGVSATIKEVTLLQQTLKDMGYFTGTPNGVFGPQTKEAVKAYQALKLKNVIAPWQISKPTGWAYQATIRQLNTDLGCYQTVTLDNGVVLK